MKKLLISLIIIFCAVLLLAACTNTKAAQTGVSTGEDQKLHIVCTTFPQYDWVRQILGERIDQVNLVYLLDQGVDLHSYQPTADDIIQITDCDLLIYVGGESEKWVKEAVASSSNDSRVVMNLMTVLGDRVKEENEELEGEASEEADADHDHDADEPEMDEHVWLSLKNAEVLCTQITSTLGDIDSQNAKVYQTNLEAYQQSLADLDQTYTTAVANANHNVLLFGGRFPFRYLVDDYQLEYYAAFPGCSAETEASFETVAFLADKIDELGLKNILVIEDSNESIAKTIIQNTTDKDQKTLSLDSMQSVKKTDIANGVTYLSIMEKNLEVLKEALQ